MNYDDNEVSLTPLGVISADLDTREAQWALDALELYMRRHSLVLAAVGTKLEFIHLSKLTVENK